MQMTGEYRIQAPRETVWQALNDPEVLKQCIPGCTEIEKTSDTEFSAKVTAKVGPVKAKFAGNVTLSDMDPPSGYTITGEGKGGPAGFARGGAKVRLLEDSRATLLTYDVDAQVGGKLAQIGSRLIDGTAKKMADDFFARFADLVGGTQTIDIEREPAPVSAASSALAGLPIQPGASSQAAAPAGRRLSLGVWVTGLIVVVLLLLAAYGL